MTEKPSSIFDIIGTQLQGMSEERAEQWMLENLGEIPSIWGDPITRADLLNQNIACPVIEAHLNFFEQSYGDDTRQGDRARAVGDLRNVDGQGMPGERQWRDTINSTK